MRRYHWLWIPLSFLAVVVLGSYLTPSPTGLGTHQALGLPPCLFHHLTGWPCPSCGLTTSLTHWLHGHWGPAFRVHPLGPPIFLLWGILSLWAMMEFFGRSTPLGKFLKGEHANFAYGALAIYLLTWGSRLAWAHF